MTPSITESDILEGVGNFLMATLRLPAAQIIVGQDNQVPEPQTQQYVVMTPGSRKRLETNVESDADATMTASIAGNILTVSAVLTGAVALGAPVFGVGVAAMTYITAFGTGSGGTGTYQVNTAPTVASELMAFGSISASLPTEMRVQLDFHDQDSAADMAQVVITAWRSDYACEFLSAYGFQPLFTSEARQRPFINGEDQYEDMWTLDVVLQANPLVSTPQQFATTLRIGLIEIDAEFPPGG